MLNQKNKYAPDVLDCIANLSNDEVFTSPKLANQMLDMVPQELFSNPRAKILDPFCKSGVFLREIVKRLDRGLEDIIPDKQQRIDHILHKQVFGIAITELTAQLSRRTLYCSKYACAIKSGEIWISDDNDDKHGIHEAHSYSISEFTADDVNNFCISPIQGNVRFNRTIKHNFDETGTCKDCGANKQIFAENSHVYELLHINDERMEELKNMKWDLIIGNPPYQLNVGNDGGNKSKSKAIYHKFIDQAIKLCPRYLTMIIPSRWMTKTADGVPDNWVDEMLLNNHLSEIHDFADANSCFSGVEIKGGVSYFLWNEDTVKNCKYVYEGIDGSISTRTGKLDPFDAGVIIRQPYAHSILNKIINIEGDYFKTEQSFSSLVSPKDFFNNKKFLNSAWDGYVEKKDAEHSVKFYISKNMKGIPFAWIKKSDIPKNIKTLPLHKVYIPAASGTGMDSKILGTPIYGEPNSVSSQTYLVIGYDPEKHNLTKEQCENIIKYLSTKFLRYCVSIKKMTQNGSRGSYQFVPLQDFTNKSDINWNQSIDEIDKYLYKKYDLSEKEIEFIETIIKPMDDEVNEEV